MIRSAKQIFEEELSGEPLTQESVIEAIWMAQKEILEHIHLYEEAIKPFMKLLKKEIE